MPQPDPSKAWVSLEEEIQDVMLADKLDGNSLPDGRYFEIPPGSHDLQVQLHVDNNDSAPVLCDAKLHYAGFVAGGHYSLKESHLGAEYRVRLHDASGKQLAATDVFYCVPG
ncbi:hypothetical protein [Pseudomonas panipatensis]|nr:hypothetical protein [Pseudomonas panipatensis]